MSKKNKKLWGDQFLDNNLRSNCCQLCNGK